MTIMTVGIDLAKNVFSVHGVDENGKVALRHTVRRDHVLELIATLHPCVIAMDRLRTFSKASTPGISSASVRRQQDRTTLIGVSVARRSW
jgi:transposase